MESNQVVDRKLIGRPMEILLVEDGLMDARVTIEALTNNDIKHRLTLVRDGEEAMDFLLQRGRFAQAPRPDLILLDLMLPKKSGMDVLSDIRGDMSLKSIPVVVLTASEVGEDRERCQLMDVNSFIHKPVNLAKFLSVVKQLKKYWMDDVILPTVE